MKLSRLLLLTIALMLVISTASVGAWRYQSAFETNGIDLKGPAAIPFVIENASGTDWLSVAAGGLFTFTQTGTTGTGITIARNLAAASTNAPMVAITNSAGAGDDDDQAVLKVRQDGTGDVVQFYDGGTKVLSLADAGVLTFGNGATMDNQSSATVLNLTETTIRATGILDVTGNSTLASVDVGGGYSGGSGATIAATGAAQFNGALTVDSTITGTGVAAITTANTSATPSAAQRSITGTINVGTATAITGVTNNPSFAGVRGVANLGDISGTGQPYVYGTQGKIMGVSGKTYDNANLWAAGIFAQGEFAQGTYTNGQFAPLWVDIGTANASAIAAKANFNMIRVTNTQSGFTLNSILSVTANAAYFLDLSCADGVAGWYAATASGGATRAFRIKVKIAGTDAYLSAYTD